MRGGEVSPAYKRTSARIKNLRNEVRSYAANVIPAKNTRRFCIVTTFRTGSELLVDLLNAHPRIRCDGEILNRRPLFPYVLARGRVREAARAGFAAYGFKVVSIQLMDFFNPPDNEFIRKLAHDGFVFVHLRRRNVFQQAVSALRAMSSGRWHQRDDGDIPGSVITIDIPTVFFEMRLIEAHDDALTEMLQDCLHHTLWYEDHLEKEEQQQSTVDHVCGWLGVEPQPVTAKLKKIASSRLEDDVANLDEVIRHLRQTRYASFVDP